MLQFVLQLRNIKKLSEYESAKPYHDTMLCLWRIPIWERANPSEASKFVSPITSTSLQGDSQLDLPTS